MCYEKLAACARSKAHRIRLNWTEPQAPRTMLWGLNGASGFDHGAAGCARGRPE